MKIQITQYLAPHGMKKEFEIEIDDTYAPQYKDMTDKGYRFSAEVLGTGVISVAVENDERDADIVLVPRGDESTEEFITLLKRGLWNEK